MIALDTNIIIELLVENHEEHNKAIQGLENLHDALAVTPVNVSETLRLLTHPKIFSKPLNMIQAIEVFDDFLEANDITILNESLDWWKHLKDIAKYDIPDLRGNDVFDSQIAMCLKHNGVTRIWTKDSDFRKFDFLAPIHIIKDV